MHLKQIPMLWCTARLKYHMSSLSNNNNNNKPLKNDLEKIRGKVSRQTLGSISRLRRLKRGQSLRFKPTRGVRVWTPSTTARARRRDP